jgi:hypothetical protein
MIGWLHGPAVGGFQRLIPCQFISVDALRVAPGIDTPACTPGSTAAGVAIGFPSTGRSHVSLPDHGPAFAGEEQ